MNGIPTVPSSLLSSEPISERKKIYNACIIKQMIQNHADITDEEKTAILQLLDKDETMRNRIGLSERLPGEGRVAHAFRTFSNNRALRKVALTTCIQLAKTAGIAMDWKNMNLPDKASRVAKLTGGYIIWFGQVVDATTMTIGYEPCPDYLINQADKI